MKSEQKPSLQKHMYTRKAAARRAPDHAVAIGHPKYPCQIIMLPKRRSRMPDNIIQCGVVQSLKTLSSPTRRVVAGPNAPLLRRHLFLRSLRGAWSLRIRCFRQARLIRARLAWPSPASVRFDCALGAVEGAWDMRRREVCSGLRFGGTSLKLVMIRLLTKMIMSFPFRLRLSAVDLRPTVDPSHDQGAKYNNRGRASVR